MTNSHPWHILAFWLVAPALAFAQTPGQPAGGPHNVLVLDANQRLFMLQGNEAQLARMYEDIEILRRLLHDKLEAAYLPAEARIRLWDSATGRLLADLGQNNLKGMVGSLGTPRQSWDIKRVAENLAFSPDGKVLATEIAGAPQLAFPEGVYFKGQGVVYTVTLPPPPPSAAEITKPIAKPLSDWERIRKQLRGEKVEPVLGIKVQIKPTVADVILKLLAENGHHFAELPENESITLVVTFRKSAEGAATASGSGSMNPGGPSAQMGSGTGSAANMPGGMMSQMIGRNAMSGGAGSGAVMGGTKSVAQTERDYEFLADLHVKQGNTREAIKTFEKAAQKERNADHAAALYLKIANLYLTAEKNEEAARKAMDKARDLLNRAAGKPAKGNKPAAKTPAPLKLIITVPKRLLDLAGSGKISFEQFKKDATVEYITVGSPSNKPAKKSSN